MSFVSIPHRTTGYTVTASDWNAVADDLDALNSADATETAARVAAVFAEATARVASDPIFATFIPHWRNLGAGAQPDVMNGALNGSCQRVGKVVTYRISLSIGSTTTFGSSTYTFDAPSFFNTSPSSNMDALVSDSGCANWYVQDASAGGVIYGGTCIVSSGVIIPSGLGGDLRATIPITLAVGDLILINGTYFVP